ncbi:hypothetical protein DBR41_30425, partial [Pseudomonas sp. HMWF010]
DGRPLRGVIVQMLQNHAHGTFTDFRGVGRGLFYSLIFSRVEASTKPGAIHCSLRGGANFSNTGLVLIIIIINMRVT